MFADFIRLIHRKDPSRYESNFVREVNVRETRPRNRRVERVIAAGWIIILIKCVAVVWLFNRYHVPVNALWVTAPTVVFAALCTVVYLLRD